MELEEENNNNNNLAYTWSHVLKCGFPDLKRGLAFSTSNKVLSEHKLQGKWKKKKKCLDSKSGDKIKNMNICIAL